MIYDLSAYDRDCYTVPKAAPLMGVSRAAARRFLIEGTLAAMWELGKWKVPAAEIERRKQGHPLTRQRRRQVFGAALDADENILPQRERKSGPFPHPVKDAA